MNRCVNSRVRGGGREGNKYFGMLCNDFLTAKTVLERSKGERAKDLVTFRAPERNECLDRRSAI
jgi:hypothetical protein